MTAEAVGGVAGVVRSCPFLALPGGWKLHLRGRGRVGPELGWHLNHFSLQSPPLLRLPLVFAMEGCGGSKGGTVPLRHLLCSVIVPCHLSPPTAAPQTRTNKALFGRWESHADGDIRQRSVPVRNTKIRQETLMPRKSIPLPLPFSPLPMPPHPPHIFIYSPSSTENTWRNTPPSPPSTEHLPHTAPPRGRCHCIRNGSSRHPPEHQVKVPLVS